MYPSRCSWPVQHLAASCPSLHRLSIAPTKAGCRCSECRWPSFSDAEGYCFGAGCAEVTFGDTGLEAALDSSALTLEESPLPQPESRLVAHELCLLTDGGVTVGGVMIRDDPGLEFDLCDDGRRMNIMLMAATGDPLIRSFVLSLSSSSTDLRSCI